MRMLLVEDDAVLGNAVRDFIALQGHAVDWAGSRADAAHLLAASHYDMLLLDLHLGDGDGLDLLRSIRRSKNTVPSIILTARDRLSERIEGLNAGADDYLVKPFELQELTARIAAVTRRASMHPGPVVRIGELELDVANRIAARRGQPISLTAREWVLIEELLRKPGATVGKRRLEDAIYALGMEVESNTIEVYVSRLRKKVGADAIGTVRGVGYRLAI